MIFGRCFKVIGSINSFTKLNFERPPRTSMADAWSETCARLLQLREHHRVLDLCGTCAGRLARSLNEEASPGVIPAGLLVANAFRPEGLEEVIRQVDPRHRSVTVFTASAPQKFPQLFTASPDEKLRAWTAPTGREPTGQFLFEFDRVLCAPRVRAADQPDQPWHRHPLHVRMLQRGLALMAPGGRLAFVTQSQHSVENEAVVAAVLRKSGPSVRLVDAQDHVTCSWSTGHVSWTVPSPDKAQPISFRSWEDVPAKLRQGKVLRTMFPSKEDELEAGSQLSRCLRLDEGCQPIFVAVFTKEMTAPRGDSSPHALDEEADDDRGQQFPAGCSVTVKESEIAAKVVGLGRGAFAGLIKIRYPDDSTYHVAADELEQRLTQELRLPTLAKYAAAGACGVFLCALTRPLLRRTRWILGGRLQLVAFLVLGAIVHSRQKRNQRLHEDPMPEPPTPGSRLVRGCSTIPQPVQSFCKFFGCLEALDGLAYRTADKHNLYLVSPAVFRLRVPEQLRQTPCGMPVLTRCIEPTERQSSELQMNRTHFSVFGAFFLTTQFCCEAAARTTRYWGCELKPRDTMAVP